MQRIHIHEHISGPVLRSANLEDKPEMEKIIFAAVENGNYWITVEEILSALSWSWQVFGDGEGNVEIVVTVDDGEVKPYSPF